MTNLSEIMEEVYRLDFAQYDNPPYHFFSFRHRKAMKRLFNPSNGSKNVGSSSKIGRRVLILVIAAFTVLVSVTAGAAMIRGFSRKVHKDNTQLFAVDTVNCPQTIEYLYYLPEIPEGYEFCEQMSESVYVYTSYINSSNKTMILHQFVKKVYSVHYDNEYSVFEELEINGKYAVFRGTEKGGSLVWDNGDYVLQISGNFTKEELITLATSVEREN